MHFASSWISFQSGEFLLAYKTSFFPSLVAVSCISRKAHEAATNKEEIDGKEHIRKYGVDFVFILLNVSLLCLKSVFVEEDMMMDSVQSSLPAQPTAELTELGKCLMKHEVGDWSHTTQSIV